MFVFVFVVVAVLLLMVVVVVVVVVSMPHWNLSHVRTRLVGLSYGTGNVLK